MVCMEKFLILQLQKKSDQAALKIWIDKCLDREKDRYIFFVMKMKIKSKIFYKKIIEWIQK